MGNHPIPAGPALETVIDWVMLCDIIGYHECNAHKLSPNRPGRTWSPEVPIMTKRRPTNRKPSGFSLVELLVVIAMIGVLISLIIYATGTLQQTSRGLTCLSNQRQIMVAWDGYATDNSGRYVAPDTDRNDWDWVRSIKPQDDPDGGGTLEFKDGQWRERDIAITQGTLWPYMGDFRLYKSPVTRTDNLRSYSLSSFFSDGEGSSDWGGPPTWRISTRSRIPKPSETICVVTEFDHRGYNINGWGISPFGPTWIDKLMIWDTGYFNFAFADGHVERYKWAGESYTDSDPIDVAFMRPQTDVYYPGPDWDWISKRLFPGTRALYGGW